MNIFILHENPEIAASYLCDKHVLKMIIESFQMLSTTRRYYGDDTSVLYKPTHINHPCTMWVKESKQNYNWLVRHVKAIHDQYYLRYRKTHYSFRLLYDIVKEELKQQPDVGLTPFALAMPNEFKNKNAVKAYRSFYVHEKYFFARWTHPSFPPYWYVLGLGLKNQVRSCRV